MVSLLFKEGNHVYSIYQSIHIFIYPSNQSKLLANHLTVHDPSLYPYINLPIFLYIHLSISPSFYPSIYTSCDLSKFPSIYLSTNKNRMVKKRLSSRRSKDETSIRYAKENDKEKRERRKEKER